MLIAGKDWTTLSAGDQLNKEIEGGRLFAGFREGPLKFAPTYRMEKGRDEYSNKKSQVRRPPVEPLFWYLLVCNAERFLHGSHPVEIWSSIAQEHQPAVLRCLLCVKHIRPSPCGCGVCAIHAHAVPES
jgi:hypothetical protein